LLLPASFPVFTLLPSNPVDWRIFAVSKAIRAMGWGLRTLSGLAGVVAGLLALRLIFRLLIANPANPVVELVYTISRPFLFPWGRIWPPSELPVLIVEKATLFSLGSFLVAGAALGLLARAARRRCGDPVEERRNRSDETENP